MSESCCVPRPAQQTVIATAGACPQCGQKGKSVQHVTLQSLLLVDLRLLQADAYRFCRTPGCPVAYFAADGSETFTVEQVRVPILQKQPATTTPVCYCFKWTPTRIRDELVLTGASSVIDQINAGIKAGLCACEITNPQGSCCLGNVRAAVAAVENELGVAGDEQAALNETVCIP